MKPCAFRSQPSKFFPKKPALKKFLIFSQEKAFLIFSQMKPYIFHLKLKELKEIHPEKNFLYFRKGEKLLIFFSKESCSYVSGKRNPPPKKKFIFQETELSELKK